MTHTIAVAEKINGNTHWTIYDGLGGVYRAKRNSATRRWTATRTTPSDGKMFVSYGSDTLRAIRQRIAYDASKA